MSAETLPVREPRLRPFGGYVGRDAHYDAVVVGARCAGAATALLLARAGARVLVLDRSAEGSDTLSTHALMRAGVIQLQRWGLLDELVGLGTPPVRRTTFRYGDVTTTITLKPVGGVDALYAPRRTVLDPLLANAARDAGAEMRFGWTVTDLLRADDGRVVGVAATDPGGTSRQIRATWTIGADGLHSFVARRVEAPVERRSSGAGAVIYAHVEGVGTDAYEWTYADGVTAGVIPTNGGAACVFAGTTPRRFRRDVSGGLKRAFRTLLREASADLAERVAAGAHGRLRSFPGAPGRMLHPWGPGWALVGDAGNYKDPLSAHGITDAFRDAELLARAVIDVLSGATTEGIGMDEYHRTRNRLSIGVFDAIDPIATYRWDVTTIEPMLRALSASMADEVEYLNALTAPTPLTLAG